MRLTHVVLFVTALVALSKSDDSPGPGFFLKITKNVPRIGRRSEREYDSFFLKNSKTIPRIGRGMEATAHQRTTNMISWLKDDTENPQSISKRVMLTGAAAAAAAEREYSVVQPVNSNTLIELLNKDAIPSENVKFVHWKDFDHALQMDMELYTKVISLGRKPDQRLKEDLGFSSYVPVSFFHGAHGNNAGGAGYYDKMGNELYAGKYESDMLEYNEVK